jgi:hypothetical protein
MNFQEVLEEAGYEPMPYSGRGMYGKYCVGVRTGDIGHLFADILSVTKDNSSVHLDEVSDAFRCMRTDSLGLDVIIYFPTVEYSDQYSNEDDDGQ